MTPCPEPRDVLAAYVDGELDGPTRQALARHLAECGRCRADVEGQRQVKRFLAPGAALAPAVPAGLADRVRAAAYGAGGGAAPAGALPRRLVLPPRRGLSLPRFGWPSSRGLRSLVAGAAVAVLLLVLGMAMDAFGWGPFTQSKAATAAAMSLQDHVMCETTPMFTLHGDSAAARAQLATTLRLPITLPAKMPGDYHFDGAHPVGLGSTTGAHFAWVARTPSDMLSIYEAHDPGGSPPPGWRPVQLDRRNYWIGTEAGTRAVFWRDADMIYLVVGVLPETTLLDVARSVESGG